LHLFGFSNGLEVECKRGRSWQPFECRFIVLLREKDPGKHRQLKRGRISLTTKNDVSMTAASTSRKKDSSLLSCVENALLALGFHS